MDSRGRRALVLVGFLIACFGVAGAGAAITATSVGGWYQTLAKPSFNPPDGVFAPVWNLLYAMMAIAAWRIWRAGGFARNRAAFALFALQLALNLGWSALFFGAQAIGLAFIEMIALWIAIVATTIVFWRRDNWAGVLMLPYAAWVAFALVLNAIIWRLN